MDRIIETLASGFGNSIGWLAEHGVLFLVFGLLWAGFAVAVIWSQGTNAHRSTNRARRSPSPTTD